VQGDLGWVAAVVAVVFMLAWYLSFLALRLDRLHIRIETARAALDTQLVRRAGACLDVAAALDPATALLLADIAVEVLDAGERPTTPGEAALHGREEAENGLSRAIHLAFGDLPAEAVPDSATEAVIGLARACERVQLARRFYNDAVAQAQRVRRHRIVRWTRLAGTASYPVMFEIDDSVPDGLAR
jgi:hypothetical protein